MARRRAQRFAAHRASPHLLLRWQCAPLGLPLDRRERLVRILAQPCHVDAANNRHVERVGVHVAREVSQPRLTVGVAPLELAA